MGWKIRFSGCGFNNNNKIASLLFQLIIKINIEKNFGGGDFSFLHESL